MKVLLVIDKGLAPRRPSMKWLHAEQKDGGEMAEIKRVLILCTGNSARSQMAEGILSHDGGGRFEVESAGVNPSRVRPEAIEAMREIGIDISSHRSKSADEFVGQDFDYIITVCDNARETYPTFPGRAGRCRPRHDDGRLPPRPGRDPRVGGRVRQTAEERWIIRAHWYNRRHSG